MPGRRRTRVPEAYLKYLEHVRHFSPATLQAYGRDLEAFTAFCDRHYGGRWKWSSVDRLGLRGFLGELAAEMMGPGRSVMVHVEGTRSLSCRNRVEKMSGAFVDMALAVGAPVVPVRFVGGLPADPLEERLEFPLGMGRQDIHLGKPLLPGQLGRLHYGARKGLVVAAINGLGVPNALEQPLPGDSDFERRVNSWQTARGVSHEHATLREVLAELEDPGDEVRRLLAASDAAALAGDESPAGRWLAELGRRLLGA